MNRADRDKLDSRLPKLRKQFLSSSEIVGRLFAKSFFSYDGMAVLDLLCTCITFVHKDRVVQNPCLEC
jgi:hypothetical protein